MDKKNLILNILNTFETPIYGVFEGAIIKDLWIDVDIWNLPYHPLYKGESDKISKAIPYIIKLDSVKNKEACLNLLSHFEKNAILLFTSHLAMDKLLEKFQYFYHIIVNDVHMLRRFYDPRIFHQFISEIDLESRLRFFADVESFFVENSQGKLIKYSKDKNQLSVKEIKIKES
jgi:hypothetical protein